MDFELFLHLLVRSLEIAFLMFWNTLWALLLGLGVSGAVQAFASRRAMERAMGDHRPRSLALASVLGAASSSCSYAATAMARSLFQKGADFTTAVVFMVASTNLVLELGLVLWALLGWQFALSEYLGGVVMIGLLALVARFFFRPRLVEAARRRLEPGGGGQGREEPATEPWTRRARSLAGWADASTYTLADLAMLGREMTIGYLVAGLVVVWVPAAAWNVVFMPRHGVLTSIENALVGPLIAVLSFVCSIGNVPLAAALWSGGISFGGVVSFIFADLITLPLILVYRRYYGWALTLRLVVALWLVMAAAGLVAEVLFAAAGLVPAAGRTAPADPGFEWSYTTFLDLGFLVLFGVQVWLARNRQRLGGGRGYAIDPVCGMQVEVASAPARAEHEGRTSYFCCDRCRERFQAAPARFPKSEPIAPEP